MTSEWYFLNFPLERYSLGNNNTILKCQKLKNHKRLRSKDTSHERKSNEQKSKAKKI